MIRLESLRRRVGRRWVEAAETAPWPVLAAMGSGYRGLLGTREWLYARGVLRSRPVGCPVVSIGNLTVGGTGKTPAAEAAVLTVRAMGHRPALVSRGYGRRTRGIQIVADRASIRMDAEEAGDEPFLLARRLPGVPVVVGANRYEAARTALERFGVSVIVLDDGFQHRTVRKDLEIVMARARSPWGNGRLFPGGPLREPLQALERADLVIATGAAAPHDALEVVDAVAQYAPGTPVLAADYEPAECWEASRLRPVALGELRDRRLLAFAGIAVPDGFADTLSSLGVRVDRLVEFADHHWYSRADLSHLDAEARATEGLITTEKDWVRLRTLPPPERPLYVLSVRLRLRTGRERWREAFARACPAT